MAESKTRDIRTIPRATVDWCDMEVTSLQYDLNRIVGTIRGTDLDDFPKWREIAAEIDRVAKNCETVSAEIIEALGV